MSRGTGPSVFGLLFAAVAVVGTARGDDWKQFCYDPGKPGGSREAVKLPLTELWSWQSDTRAWPTPLLHAVVASGRAYFLTLDKGKRYLICGDARTGSVA